MNLKEYIIGCLFLICIVCLCGCLNQGITTEKTFDNIIFESDIVELAKANMEFIQEEMYDDYGKPCNKTRAVEVKYLLHNDMERSVVVLLYIEFYDINNTIINSIGPKEIHLIKKYTEQNYSPVNIATYEGENIEDVDYVKIIAFEKIEA